MATLTLTARAKKAMLAQPLQLVKTHADGTYIDLENQGLVDDDMAALAVAIKQVQPTFYINLNGNKIGRDGMRTLAAALRHCTQLQRLGVGWNNIGDDGMCALAASLECLTKLTTLYVQNNNVTDVGAVALLEGLRACPTITSLRLSGNSISGAVQAELDAEIKKPQLERVREAERRKVDPSSADLEAVRLVAEYEAAEEAHAKKAAEAAAKHRAAEEAQAKKAAEEAQAKKAAKAAAKHQAAEEAQAKKVAEAAAKLLAERRRDPQHAAIAAGARGELSEDVLDVLSCTVCTEPITSSESILLPMCLHGVHERCAKPQLSLGPTLQCSVCQISSTLSSKTLQRHPLLEAELEGGAMRRCHACDDGVPPDEARAAYQCGECQYDLCDLHGGLHKKASKTRSHYLTPLVTSSASQRCSIHGELLKAYCIRCQETVCIACMASTHPVDSHKSILLDDDFVHASRVRLAARIKAARSVADEHLSRIADVHVCSAGIADRDEAVHVGIKTSFEALHRLLHAREFRLHSQLDAHSANELRVLQETATAEGQRWRVITSALAMSDRLGESTPPVLAQLEPAATARLEALAAQVPTLPVPFPTPIRFEITTAVAQAIETAGELVLGHAGLGT